MRHVQTGGYIPPLPPEYIDRFGSRMLPSHRRAKYDIIACRTEQMGGHLYCCQNPDCEQFVYAYHSCGNRSCPKCGSENVPAKKPTIAPAHIAAQN
jgi:hypothetical protein